MNGERFDYLARCAGREVSRRRVLAMLGVGALLGRFPRTGEATSASDAADLVTFFYECVNAYQYEQAYALLGHAWRAQQSLVRFTNGYGNTAFVQCTALQPGLGDGGSTIVPVRLISWHNDGKIVAYEGAYTVGFEAGALRILSGDNEYVPVPVHTVPLCTVSDLDFAFGRWLGAAGSREGDVITTNVGSRPCTVGGSPRLRITVMGKLSLTSTSEPGSPPTGIVLESGESAHAPLRFSNWCDDEHASAQITVELPGAPQTATLDHHANGIDYPPCLGVGQSAELSIKGWVAGVGTQESVD